MRVFVYPSLPAEKVKSLAPTPFLIKQNNKKRENNEIYI